MQRTLEIVARLEDADGHMVITPGPVQVVVDTEQKSWQVLIPGPLLTPCTDKLELINRREQRFGVLYSRDLPHAGTVDSIMLAGAGDAPSE